MALPDMRRTFDEAAQWAASARQDPGADAALAGGLLRPALAWRQNGQRRLGIDRPRVLTGAEAAARAAALEGDAQGAPLGAPLPGHPGDPFIDRLSAFRAELGPFYDAAIDEIAAAGLEANLAVVARITDPAIARAFAGDQAIGPEAVRAGLASAQIRAVADAALDAYAGPHADTLSGPEEDVLVDRALALYARARNVAHAAEKAADSLRRGLGRVEASKTTITGDGADDGLDQPVAEADETGIDDMFTAEDPNLRDPGATGPSMRPEDAGFDEREPLQKLVDLITGIWDGEFEFSDIVDEVEEIVGQFLGQRDSGKAEKFKVGEDPNTRALIDRELAITLQQRDVEEKLRKLWGQGDTKLPEVMDQIKEAWPDPDKQKQMETVARKVLSGNIYSVLPFVPTERLLKEQKGLPKRKDLKQPAENLSKSTQEDAEVAEADDAMKEFIKRHQGTAPDSNPETNETPSLIERIAEFFIEASKTRNNPLRSLENAIKEGDIKLQILEEELLRRGVK